MMLPTIVRWDDGRILALGSGGSNRIRSAILQVLMNHLCLGKTLGEAVEAPRIHLEKGRLHIEVGHDEDVAAQLAAAFPDHQI